MALRDQPYIPLYIQDYMTDEKLNECSAASQGIYIKIMCLMHKSENYGKILLKQKYKQNGSTCLMFANQLVKHLTFTLDETNKALEELTKEEVLFFDGDFLCQKRMIKDNELSLKRSSAGRKGGKKTQFAKDFAKANIEASTEYENEYENNINNTNKLNNSKTPDTLDFVPEPIPKNPHIVLSKEDLKQELLNSYEQKEKIMKTTKLSEQEVDDYIIEFIDEQDAKEKLDRGLKDIRSHLVSWIKLENEKKKRDAKLSSNKKQSAWEKINNLK